MRIIIAGGSGFLGRALSEHLVGRGHEVVVLTRSGGVPARTGARAVSWQPDGSATPGAWGSEIEGAGAVVNLAGAGIADKRWSRRRKELHAQLDDDADDLEDAAFLEKLVSASVRFREDGLRASTSPEAVCTRAGRTP